MGAFGFGVPGVGFTCWRSVDCRSSWFKYLVARANVKGVCVGQHLLFPHISITLPLHTLRVSAHMEPPQDFSGVPTWKLMISNRQEHKKNSQNPCSLQLPTLDGSRSFDVCFIDLKSWSTDLSHSVVSMS